MLELLTTTEKSDYLSLLERKAQFIAQKPIKPILPQAFQPLWTPARHKFARGGRDSAKSWSCARALVWMAHTGYERILCTREYQSSIRHSVHRLLKDQITNLNLAQHFYITEKSIVGKAFNSEFIFKGIHEDPDEIKSTEGITKCWLEEAEKTTYDSLNILTKTIRKPGSEIWATWNPEEENSPIDKYAVKNTPPGSILLNVSYRDNPFHSEEMERQRIYDQQYDPDNYDWVWEGGYRKISAAAILAHKCDVDEFEAPEGTRFFYGVDWGFAKDPTVLIRCFMQGDCLYIDYEAYGYGVEMEDIPALFDTVPGVRKWPIKADSARPETISYIARRGFNISAAAKWKGSVEDGIEHLRGFKRIIIHKRCEKIQQEARLYSYKTDPRQLDANNNPVVLPEIKDGWDHGWDATRYSLDGYIKHAGVGFFSL
ncbi:MAG: PBSX family phage terminase large subunit [Patescibacteria group bacterium]|nr:PBSX family phage terminase large subunit [Patescibacteria group bacterium]